MHPAARQVERTSYSPDTTWGGGPLASGLSSVMAAASAVSTDEMCQSVITAVHEMRHCAFSRHPSPSIGVASVSSTCSISGSLSSRAAMEESLSSSRLMGRCSSEPGPDGIMQISKLAQRAADVKRYLESQLRCLHPSEVDMVWQTPRVGASITRDRVQLPRQTACSYDRTDFR